jgi:cytochrome P450/nitrite reductase/ring-hydroxylating ferredoxin subunit
LKNSESARLNGLVPRPVPSHFRHPVAPAAVTPDNRRQWEVILPDQPVVPRFLARVADLQGEGPYALSAGCDVVVVRAAGGFRAFEGRCPHQGALLGEGEMDGGLLVCRNHRWRFDPADGRRLGGPECLRPLPLEQRDDELWISLPQQPQPAVVVPATRTLDQLPGPRPLPLLGNALQLEPNRLHLILEEWARAYGPVYTYSMGSQRVVAIADPDLNEQVLRARPESFRRTRNLAAIFEEMGVAGVFSAEGPAWRPQRRLAMEALSHRHLRGFFPVLGTVVRRLRDRWRLRAAAGAELDVTEELKRFTVDVTTMLVLGYDVNTIEQEDDVIQRKLELIFPAFNRRLFALLPTWRWIRTPADRRLDRALAEMRDWLASRIGETRARLAEDPSRAERPQNFLESMLTARDDTGSPFPDSTIFGNAMTMLLAGEDTTAYTVAWAIHHVGESPSAAGALRREGERHLEDGIPADIETANRLVYAGAVANESMRLRPVAPLIMNEAITNVTVGDVAIPAGAWVAVLTRPPALEDRHFTDPGVFRPERWLGDRDPGRAHEPSAHMPFGSGPRICPGRTLALVEMKLLLAMLYTEFEVEATAPAVGVREKFDFTMTPVGLKMRLRPRPRRVPTHA